MNVATPLRSPGSSSTTRARPRLSRRQLALAGGAAVLLVALALYGYHWFTYSRFMESTDDAYVGGDITIVAPKVAGLIAQVAVTDNEPVHTGQLLVKLDDRD